MSAEAETQRVLREMAGSLGEIKGQLTQLPLLTKALEAHASAVQTRFKEGDDRHEKLEKRTRRVETRQHWYAGAATIIGILAEKFAPGIFGHST